MQKSSLILQMNNAELTEFVEKEIERNPLLILKEKIQQSTKC